MTGVAITTEIDGIDRLNARLDRLARPDLPRLLHQLVAEGESQTRRRIESERRGPDGEPWADWSERYAAGRHHGHSLLIASGHLRDSITGYVDGLAAGWGSNLAYAAVHQFGYDGAVHVAERSRTVRTRGGRDASGRFLPSQTSTRVTAAHERHLHIPARPYLGISPENEDDLLAIIDAYVDRLLAQ